MGCYCRRVGAYKGVGCLIDFSSFFRLEAPAGMLGCKRDFVVEAIVGVRVSPEQVQACYQTRLLGVVGTDGGSEFGMSDVRLARDAPGGWVGDPRRPPSCIPPAHSSFGWCH